MNTRCRIRKGSSSVSLIIIVALGLLAAFGGWWMLRGRSSSGSAFSPSEREWEDMRSELRGLRQEVEALREVQTRQDDFFRLPVREPVRAGDEGEPKKGKDKVEGSLDGSGIDAFKADLADVKRLGLIEDEGEKRALAMKLLDSQSAYVRSEAILALLELDPAAGIAGIYGLLEMAGDDPKGPWSASRAVESLGDLEGYSVTSDLYRMYESEVEGVAMAAARALERQGDATLIDRELSRLTQQLIGNDPRDRLDAIRRIGETRSPRAVPHLIPLLSSPDSETRIRALDALGVTGNESHIADIERMLNDPVAAVRDRAVRAMAYVRKRGQGN